MRKAIELPLKLGIMMLIAALCLSTANALTAEPIRAQQALHVESLRAEVLPGSGPFSSIELAGAPESLLGAYISDEGYVFEMSAKGFGGAIEVFVGITGQGEVAGMRVGSNTETPGLGTKAADESFYTQYAGQRALPFTVVKMNPKENEIHAITAATVTSEAVNDAVNDAIACYEIAKEAVR